MRVTLRTLIESQSALQEIAGNSLLPIRISYWTGKVLKKVERELKDFNSARVKLCERFGKLNSEQGKYLAEDGSSVTKNPEFVSEYESLIDTEVEISVDPFTLDAIGEARISPRVMAVLEWLIVDSE